MVDVSIIPDRGLRFVNFFEKVYGKRLSNAEIADILRVTEGSIRNYKQGKKIDCDVLAKITELGGDTGITDIFSFL